MVQDRAVGTVQVGWHSTDGLVRYRSISTVQIRRLVQYRSVCTVQVGWYSTGRLAQYRLVGTVQAVWYSTGLVNCELKFFNVEIGTLNTDDDS